MLPRALARLVVRRLAEDAAARLCARAPGRLDDILELGDGALDLGDGVRAVVDDGRAADGADPPCLPRPDALGMRSADVGEILVQADDLQRRVRTSAPRSP